MFITVVGLSAGCSVIRRRLGAQGEHSSAGCGVFWRASNGLPPPFVVLTGVRCMCARRLQAEPEHAIYDILGVDPAPKKLVAE